MTDGISIIVDALLTKDAKEARAALSRICKGFRENGMPRVAASGFKKAVMDEMKKRQRRRVKAAVTAGFS